MKTFAQWWVEAPHRRKYSTDHPAYLAAQEAWQAATEAAKATGTAGELPPVSIKPWHERIGENFTVSELTSARDEEIADLRAALAATNRSQPPIKLKEVIENLYNDNLDNLLGGKS